MITPFLPVYRRCDIAIVRGEGPYLFDDQGKRYLDFASGIGVNSLGHAHPALVKALSEQAQQLWHCSNLYQIPGLARLAERYVAATFADTVFFCNTGTEAVECGIKMIRRHFAARGQEKRHRIITFEGGFHGRSMACISAGGNELARRGFAPLLDGFDSVPFNDLAATAAAIGENTAGILVEPVQGEGGIRPATAEFLRGLRDLADRHGLLLFFDEVQCGMGRLATLCAHEHYGVTPDIMSVAKGIGGGFPLAACMATEYAASGLTPGSHGSTYGSNPLAMAVGNAVLDEIQREGFFDNVRERGAQMKAGLEELAQRLPALIAEIRGEGLMLGIRMQAGVDHREQAQRLREHGLMTAPAEENVLRLLPPLNIKPDQVVEALDILHKTWELRAL